MVRERSSKTDAALRREIETLQARIAKMSEVSRRITESLDLDTVLQEVVDGAPLPDRRSIWRGRGIRQLRASYRTSSLPASLLRSAGCWGTCQGDWDCSDT